ncbi:hypothetical protein [Nocardia sp. NPDC050793]|uniref:hypothetical protein n=1 Tax=Nocardia sp. NPDC050793 TaxID=3155159 RepID=UPI0033C3F136
MDQAMRDMTADAVATLDGPCSIGVLFCSGEHFAIPGVVGAVSARGQDLAGVVDDFDRG